MLMRFGITESVFNAMRRSNIAHEPEGFRKDGKPKTALAKQIQKYNTEIDNHEWDWSEARVGYIVSFFWAVTSPNTNYFSMSDNERTIEANRYPTPKKFRNWVSRQYMYLIRYGGFETIEEFDDRYGDGGPISQKILDGAFESPRVV